MQRGERKEPQKRQQSLFPWGEKGKKKKGGSSQLEAASGDRADGGEKWEEGTEKRLCDQVLEPGFETEKKAKGSYLREATMPSPM